MLLGLLRRVVSLLVCVLVLDVQAQDSAQLDLAVVEGVVTDLSTSLPMSEVPVTLTAISSSSDEEPTQSAITDERGRFRMQAPPGRYLVEARLTGFIPDPGGETITLIPRQELANLRIQLAPLLAISGRVTDERGTPLSGIQVFVAQPYYNEQGGRAVRPCWESGTVQSTDDRGEYRLYGLKPGEYYLGVAQDGCRTSPTVQFYPDAVDPSSAVPVILGGANDLTGVDFRLTEGPAYSVRFRIQREGSNDWDAMAMFRLLRQPGPMEVIRTGLFEGAFTPDGEGDWISTGLPPGAYTLYYTPGHFSFEAGEIAFAIIDRDVDAGVLETRSPVTVRGQVRAEGTSVVDLNDLELRFRSVDGPALLFRQLPATIRPNGSFSITLRTGPDLDSPRRGIAAEGQYEIDLSGLPPDGYLASALYGGQETLYTGLSIDGEPAGPLELILDGPGGVVEGVVRDARDEPVSDAQVLLMPTEPGRQGNSTLFETAFTDQTGGFVFRGVRPGNYQVLAWEEPIETNAWLNADFRRSFQTRAESIQVEKAGRDTLELDVIAGN